MSIIKTIRMTITAVLALFLTAAVFTGYGKEANDPTGAKNGTPGNANAEQEKSMPGATEYANGLAAWEKKDYEEAAKSFRAAAEQGHTDAMVLYAVNCLEKGKGIEKDEDAATDWLKKAADAGNATAQAFYGTALANQSKTDEGLGYLKRSADSGDALGLYFLGGVYLEMTQKEKPLGFECMKKAASMPLTDKKSVIDDIDGLAVAFGGDLDHDEKFNNNTNRIIVQAQYIVGALYRSGELPGGRDMGESLKWMNKAKENGSARAATYLKMIEMMQQNQGH